MSEPDLCLNTVEIVNGEGSVQFRLVCLLRDDHTDDCMYQRFSSLIDWEADD